MWLDCLKAICSLNQKKIYGVAQKDIVSINCSASANSGQELVLHWTLNYNSEFDSIQETHLTLFHGYDPHP